MEFAIPVGPRWIATPRKTLWSSCARTADSTAPKAARHDRALYHFTDGFLQDLQGEMASCRNCRKALHITPVVMLHDQDEKRRFEAVFATCNP